MSNEQPRIQIYDTTLRDGSQAEGVSLSLEDKVLIARALDELGVDYIEGGYPLSNPKDEAFFSAVKERTIASAKIAAFGMTRRKGVAAADDVGMKALLASGAPVITIVGKCWDLHARDVLDVSEQENKAMIADSVACCVAAGREVIFDAEHFFDGWRANRAFALGALQAAAEAGAACLALCDTNGGSRPDHVQQIVSEVCAALPNVRVGIHCHNDSGLAVANSLAAVAGGATHVQGTINGIGERCGNADLIAVIAALTLKYGRRCLGEDRLVRLTEVSRYVYEVTNLNFRPDQPYVGSAAFAHKAGMHVHAVRRNPVTYEHVDPAVVGNTRRILVSELSGTSNIAALTDARFGIASDRQAQKKVLDALMQMESQGYQFEAAEASYDVLVRKTLAGKWYRQFWELDHFRCIIQKHNAGKAVTEATVKLTIDGQAHHEVCEGGGPVDSLYGALRAALRRRHPGVDDLHLVDYKVRVVNTAAETAAKVRVVIDWHDEHGKGYFGSVGVSENIIEASWLALVDAVEYKLLHEMEVG
ncbi:MAG: citramalate synthase [Planctomycetaceae bacterium]|nr:citramalate synthase [Planctomycetaceae bacterium]